MVKKKSGMRRMLSCLLTVCLLAGMFPSAAFATDSNVVTYPVTGGNIYFNKSTGAVTNCDKSVTEVMIPRKIEGVVVQEIGNCAFRYCYDLENIIIPDSVTIIGEEAFRSCRNLKSIIIPDGVTVIEDYIFSDCNSLNSIYIPDGIVKIGDYAFYGCSNLKNIELPDSITEIGVNVFNYCNSLSYIKIPGNVTQMGGVDFYGCSSLITAGPIGSGCNYEYGWKTEIPGNAFSGGNSLKKNKYCREYYPNR